ncbi:MAG: hypothetical protein WB783_11310, partial [Arenicellales bacterium]
MSAFPAAQPHRIVYERPGWCAFLVLASLALSFWAIHLNPVINADGTGAVRAARSMLGGRWHEGLELARRPFYSALIALTSRVTGMTAAHGAYVLNTGLFAVLVLG